MDIRAKTLGPLMVNCYLVFEKGSPEGIVIDPGYGAAHIAKWLENEGIKDVLIILTHGHFDHTNAADELAEICGAKILMNKADEFLLDASGDDMAAMMGYRGKAPRIDSSLEDGMEVKHGSVKFEIIHTPGHSPGSVCLYADSPDEPVLFSADTLFNLGIGRTDLPGGNWREILNSIVERLWPLPGHTRVLPGHGPETTLDFEKRNNPFLSDV
jgi:hydroxyacylglutathione hydrolase